MGSHRLPAARGSAKTLSHHSAGGGSSARKSLAPHVLSVSTPPNAGLKMFRPMWPSNCAGAAICNCATSRFFFRTSSNDTKVDFRTSSFRCPCALFNHGNPAQKARGDRRQSSPPRLYRGGAGIVDRQSPEPPSTTYTTVYSPMVPVSRLTVAARLPSFDACSRSLATILPC
jgi:hypothetical protein